jgi:hypothetical protein
MNLTDLVPFLLYLYRRDTATSRLPQCPVEPPPECSAVLSLNDLKYSTLSQFVITILCCLETRMKMSGAVALAMLHKIFAACLALG